MSESKSASQRERSFIMLKPDAVQRGLVGKVIQRFEEKGYKLVGPPASSTSKCPHPGLLRAEEEAENTTPIRVEYYSISNCCEHKAAIDEVAAGAVHSPPGTWTGPSIH